MIKTHKAEGFSLVELMIVVSIIAILVSIGFPLYGKYATKAKSTEAMNVMGAIRTMQISYKCVDDTYLTLIKNPPGDVSSTDQPWGNPGGNWGELGFDLNKTRYQFLGEVGPTGVITTSFLLTAQSDLDGQGEPYDTWTLDSNGDITHTNMLK